MSRMLIPIDSMKMTKAILTRNPKNKYEFVCKLLKQGKKVWLIVNETPLEQACTRLQKLTRDYTIQTKEKDAILISYISEKIPVNDLANFILSKSIHDYTYSPDAIVIERMESLSYNTVSLIRKELEDFAHNFKCNVILCTSSITNYYAYTF